MPRSQLPMVVQVDRAYKLLVVGDEPEVEPMFWQRMRRGIGQGKYRFLIIP